MAAANMKRVLVVEAVDEAGLSLLRARPDIEFEVVTDNLQARMEEEIQEVNGITLRRMPLPADLIEQARASVSSRAMALATMPSTWPH